MQAIKIGRLYVYPFKSKQELIAFITNQKKILIAVNAEKLLRKERELIEIINSNIGYADGIGTVWALKQKGIKFATKIPGVELWYSIVKEFYISKSFYLIGATNDVIQLTVEKLHQEFKGIQIVGYHSGYFNESEKLTIINDLKIKMPDIVFIAMGSPKQEYIMNEFFQSYPALYMGLGGSFDVYTNKVKRAPRFFVVIGAEWLFRLITQPKRIKRQIRLVKFIYLLIFRKL
ncbi:MAG: WecB/TagA/CpsF family glycosyltransferase [Bacteroidales bacterium]|nr:WecB/TagA/CpsF family glycosyltransferase [Bacteroidales bacterium]